MDEKAKLPLSLRRADRVRICNLHPPQFQTSTYLPVSTVNLPNYLLPRCLANSPQPLVVSCHGRTLTVAVDILSRMSVMAKQYRMDILDIVLGMFGEGRLRDTDEWTLFNPSFVSSSA